MDSWRKLSSSLHILSNRNNINTCIVTFVLQINHRTPQLKSLCLFKAKNKGVIISITLGRIFYQSFRNKGRN